MTNFEELKQNFLPRFWDKENKVMIYPELDKCESIAFTSRAIIGNIHEEQENDK